MNTPSWQSLLTLDDRELLVQCEVDTFRGTGPGGQKRNKTESAVRLRHVPSGVVARSDESRSQHKNKQHALSQLRRAIALELRGEIDLESYAPPPDLIDLLAGRFGRRNARYPSAMAALLDLLLATAGRLSDAAKAAGSSTSKISRAATSDPTLLQKINADRAAAGLRSLRPR
ncbi:MAG: peptide chain release factor-like protein [Deltaproteobacteria bacterium]|nr:peptide chain release factor-like protein [Deltaproteobacteria bacterium]